MTPLLESPATTAIVTDFDGTLSPIVEDPPAARPVEGAADMLEQLAHRFGVVAVISGRPVSFLVEHLTPAADRSQAGAVSVHGGSARLVGLYGLEWTSPDGAIATEPEAERWRPSVERAAARLGELAPAGVMVEAKGLAVTVHWRRAPDAASWAISAVEAEVDRTGLLAHHGRMSIELRPPMAADKGSAIKGLVAQCSAACYFGDDLGDLPAFAALRELRSGGRMATVSVAVLDGDDAEEVAEAADVVVQGPLTAFRTLCWLAEEEL